jgi:hypothetical protein
MVVFENPLQPVKLTVAAKLANCLVPVADAPFLNKTFGGGVAIMVTVLLAQLCA